MLTDDEAISTAPRAVAGHANPAPPREAPRLVLGGPLTRKNHADAVLLHAPVTDELVRFTASRCHGRRSFGRPMMAMMTKKNLGPVRHVLAQMVVAGIMFNPPPVQVRVPETHGQGRVPPLRAMLPGADEPDFGSSDTGR